jgi:hypothetical protein
MGKNSTLDPFAPISLQLKPYPAFSSGSAYPSTLATPFLLGRFRVNEVVCPRLRPDGEKEKTSERVSLSRRLRLNTFCQRTHGADHHSSTDQPTPPRHLPD